MTTPDASATPPARFADEYRYGWRFVERPGANGAVEYDQVPLTLEDVLHPREGDEIPEHPVHNTERDYIKRACRSRLHGESGVLVLSDCLISLGRRGHPARISRRVRHLRRARLACAERHVLYRTGGNAAAPGRGNRLPARAATTSRRETCISVQEERDELQEALKASEREVREQTRAREDAERRMLDLEAELRCLRGEPPA